MIKTKLVSSLEKAFVDQTLRIPMLFLFVTQHYFSFFDISFEFVRLSSYGAMLPFQSSLIIDFICRLPPSARFPRRLP
jgi:hypothetical protein